MTGQEKAALLLTRFPPDQVDDLLARLGPERSERLRADMIRFQQSPPPADAIDSILRQIERQIEQEERNTATMRQSAATEDMPAVLPASPGGAPTTPGTEPTATQETTTASPGGSGATGSAQASGDALPDSSAVAADPLSALRAMSGAGPTHAAANVDRLALALTDEHPRTVALVLNQMEPERAGEVLKRLPAELRRAVSLQLGKEVTVNPDLVARIVRTVLEKCRQLAEAPPSQSGGNRFKRVAEMLRRLEKLDRMEVLATLEQNDPDTAAGVKEFLYSFDDLLLIEDRSMQKLLAEIDSKSLASALKGASEEIKDKVRNNLSKRARETLNEEMELLGTLPPPTIQAAQKSIVEVIQRLDQAGELTMLQ
jgi:flagellar motor switch protein FliG